jgi:MYXO-CTERM domain-containing protein
MRAIAVGLGVLTLVVFSHGVNQVGGEPIAIVSPNMNTDTEGEGWVTNASPNGRWQIVFPSSDFATLPDGSRTITQMALRPDGALGSPLTTTFGNALVRLSTTDASPPNLSFSFADNIGADETVVYDGPLTLSTANVGPPGGPKEFDQAMVLQTPFDYDPNEGNLLIDFRWTTLSSPQSMDFLSDPSVRSHSVSTPFSNSPTAQDEWGGLIWQLSFASTLLGDVNLDGEVNGLDVNPFVSLVTDGTYQVEGDMNEDGVVNGLDVDPFVAAVVGSGAQSIPEPSTLVLALIALGVAGAWRRRGG